MKLTDYGLPAAKPRRAHKTLRDLSLADLLDLCDPQGEPLQAELIRRINVMRARFRDCILERADAYAQADECQCKLDQARLTINRLLDDQKEHNT